MKLFTASGVVRLAGLIVVLAGFRLGAQDVTVTDPAWFNPEKPPGDTLPAFKKAPSVDYPRELRTQPGYLIAPRYIAEDGKVTRQSDWTSHPYFKEDFQWEKGFELIPAEKEGEPVGAAVWYALLFNPKSASPKAADADVRLLAVAPVIVPKERLTKVPGIKNGYLTVWTRVKVDATGAATVMSFDDKAQESFRDVIDATLPSWRFAPARKGGVAIDAEVPVAFAVMRAPGRPPAPKPDKMPVAKSRAAPLYPRSLRATGQQGEVTVRFTVDENGAVKNPVVVKSNHPAFEEPAIEAVMKWKFKPAEKDGKPLATQMQQPIYFNLNGAAGSNGALTMPVTSKKQQEKLPEELRYDVPPKIKGLLYPSYPFDLLMAKTDGNAKVAFMVDVEGRVSDVKVISADRPEFGEALGAAVAAFEFVPASRDGKPVATVFRLDHEFEANGSTGQPSREDLALAATLRKHPERILKLDALDAPLKPLSRRAPVFPQTATVMEGEALIEVIVDEDGRARLPKIIKATEPVLGYAAAQAAGEWRFEAPKSKGKAVAVRARVPFKFNSRENKGSAKESGQAAQPKPAGEPAGGA